MLRKNNSEDIDHLFLHCLVAYLLWLSLQNNTGIQWTIPRICRSLFLKTFYSYERNSKASKARVLGLGGGSII